MNLAPFIEHTLLKPEAAEADVKRICREGLKYGFAAVCVASFYAALAARELKGSNVKVCTVIGFPLGAYTTAVKAFEAGEAVGRGADELDMVINIGALKGGDWDFVREDIAAVVKAAGSKAVKAIIETSLLSREEIVTACSLAAKAGVAFVKTSTGFGPGGAEVEDVLLMRRTVGAAVKIKAAGGIRSREKALELIMAGADRIGTSSGPLLLRDN